MAFPIALPASASLAAASPATSISPIVVRGFARIAEVAIVAAIGLFIAHFYINEPGVLLTPRYLATVATVATATVIIFELLDLYSLRAMSSFVSGMPAALLGWTTSFALLVAGMFFLKIGADFSRVWLAVWFVAGASAISCLRCAIALRLRSWARTGRLYQRAVVYGASAVADDVLKRLHADIDCGVRIAGVFDDRDEARAPRQIAGFPRLGGLNDLIKMSRTTRLDLIIVALPLAAEDRLSAVVRALSVLPTDIKIPAMTTGLRFSPRAYSQVGSVAMIDLYDKPIADWGFVAKQIFDKVVALAAIILLAPIMAAVAAAVKLDSKGPALFRQKRYGFNNELIEVFKFRSMYVDQCDMAAAKLVSKGDPRVTRVGRFIRKTSLDELPQLFNVLLGDLSLVGPRPHAVQAKAGAQTYDEAVDGYFARHKVKPGITGWAQINGWRGETDTQEKILKRVEHDLYYIENWSVVFDAYILFMTPFALLKSENAY